MDPEGPGSWSRAWWTVDALRAVPEEHRVRVAAFKEGQLFLPGIGDGPAIPEGYGEAGMLFSEYTPVSEVRHRAKQGDPHARSVIGLETPLLGYFSRAVSLVQLGQTLEGFK